MEKITTANVEEICINLGLNPWDWSNLRKVENVLLNLGLDVETPEGPKIESTPI